MINVLLAVFNMIPVPPLDGGNVLMGVLPRPLAAVIDRLRPYGFFVLYALMFSAACLFRGRAVRCRASSCGLLL